MQLQGLTQLLFTCCRKNKNSSRVSQWKSKAQASKHSVSCKVSDTTVKDIEKFIQIVCYSGKEEENLTETRVPLHKQMKTKTSQSLPPGEKLMLQAIKCVHYHVYYSSSVNETILSDSLLQDNGWIINNENEEVRHYGSLVRL